MISLLFTDLEGSTRLAARTSSLYNQVLARHFEILRHCLVAKGGREFQENGDGLLLAFESAFDAASFAMEAQECLSREAWPLETGALRVRMSLHTGEAEFREGQYRGLAMNLTARLLAAAHGGQVLCSKSAARALGASSPAPLRVLGVFHLRGFEQGEEISELLWQNDLPFRQPRAEHARSHNLPPIYTPIVGRDSERAELKRLLDPNQEGVRLVTLSGPGGIGKTRLATEVARDLLDTFSHAVTLVSLADLDDPNRIAGAIRRALKITAQPSVMALEQIKDAIGTGSILLVLDNLEQLLPEGAAWVRTLLRELPGLRCLVTSRIALGLPGERVLHTRALETSKQKDGSAELSASCELFIQCARNVRPEFRVTEANRAALIQLTRLLEGVPLAIELAAARTSVLSLPQILAQIQNRFALLREHHHTTSDRHSSLDAAIHWSYNALPQKSRQVLASLSVFMGGFSLDAATQVAGEGSSEETQAALQNLRFCSLLTVEDGVSGLRFRLLETIRQYAADQLGDAKEAAMERYWRIFSTLAYTIEARLKTDVDTLWLDQLEEDHPNFLQTLACSTNPIRRLRVATALHRFWLLRGYARENRCWFTRIPDCTDVRERDVVVRAFHAAAVLDLSLMRLWRARAFFQKAYVLSEEMEIEGLAASALYNMGQIAAHRGDYQTAQSHYIECIKIFQRLSQISQLGAAMNALGICYLEEGDIKTARPLLKRSLSILKNSKDRVTYAAALQHCGYLEFCAGNLIKARGYYYESLLIHRELQIISTISVLYISLARLASAFGLFEAAARLLSAAMVIKKKLGQKFSRALAPVVPKLESNVRDALGEHRFSFLSEEVSCLEMKEILNIPIDLG